MKASLFIRSFKRLFFGPLLALVFASIAVAAEPPTQRVDPGASTLDLRSGVMRFSSFETEITPEQALARQDEFIPYADYITTYPQDGMAQHQNWVFFRLENTTAETITRYLYLEEWVDYFRIFVLRDGQLRLLAQKDFVNADRYPSDFTPFVYVPLKLHSGPETYLIEMSTYNTVLRELALYEPDVFMVKLAKESYSYSMVVGVLCIMGLYNFFLYQSFKTPEGRWFGLYIWSAVAFLLLRDRLIPVWFATAPWPAWLTGLEPMALVFGLSFLFQSLYSLHMLGLSWKKQPWQTGWVMFLAITIFVGGLLIFIDPALSLMMLNNVAGLAVMNLLVLAIYHAFRGVPTAKWLALSIPPAVAGGILELVSLKHGVKFIYNPWQLGLGLEVVILSVYLSYRIKALRRAKEEADAEHAAHLEERVHQKTKELHYANQTKDKFFSIIAHDLRGPVGSLSVLFNEVFKKGADIDDKIFTSIARSVKNTHQLLENLLTWARSQKGEIEYHPSSFLINTSIQNNIGLFQEAAQQKGISLDCEIEDPVFALADVEMVNTIIRNLVGNAIKFTELGGKVQVSACQQGEMILVEVSDSGLGMKQEAIDSLFRLDQKAHSSLGTNSESGSGLGLILCAEFVERNEGKIGVTSELGEGSNFWFTLPVGQKAEVMSEEKEQQGLARLSQMRVLVADDNHLHLETSSSVLKNLGLDFQTVINGLEALEEYKKNPFDLVLMDIDMPHMNGVEANQAIRKFSSDEPPLIVALTSYSKQELTEFAHESSFDGYLNKPLDKDKLLACLKPYLSVH